MDAIKKKMQAMKIEKDNALDRADAAEEKARQQGERVEKLEEELRDTQKKMMQIENELDKAQEELAAVNQKLEEKEKKVQEKMSKDVQQANLLDTLKKKMRQARDDAEAAKDEAEETKRKLQEAQKKREEAETEVASLHRRIQLMEEDLERAEDRLKSALEKLEEASKTADESERARKALETRTGLEDDRCAQLELKLREAQALLQETENKYEEVARKLAMVEADLERAEERAEAGENKIVELEEELRVVGNNLKSLEVSEEKALQREDSYEEQIRVLSQRLKEAETRAEFAERSVQKLQKEVDRLEDELVHEKEKYKAISEELDQGMDSNEFMSEFFQPNFDVEIYARQLVDRSVSVAGQLSMLASGTAQLEKQLKDQISTHHEKLLSQATSIESLEDILMTISQHVNNLQSEVNRARDRVDDLFRRTELRTRQLERLHEACTLLRSIIRIWQLVARLNASGPTKDIAKSSQYIQELRDLTVEVDLSGIVVVERELTAVPKLFNDIILSSRSALRQGLKTQNHTLVGTALQALINLHSLDDQLKVVTQAMIDEAKKCVSNFGRKEKSAAAEKSSENAAPGGVSMPSSVSASVLVRANLWTDVSRFTEILWNYDTQLNVLRTVVGRKRDQTTHRLLKDWLEEDFYENFWSKLTEEVIKKKLIGGDDTMSSGGDMLVRQTLESEYPRFLRSMTDLLRRLKDSELGDYSQIIRDSFVTLETAYVGKSLSRLFDAVNLAFSTGTNVVGSNNEIVSAPPRVNEIDSVVQAINTELNASVFDGHLFEMICRNIGKVVRLFGVKCEQLLCTDGEASQVIGNPSVGQKRNVELVNAIHYFRSQIFTLLERIALTTSISFILESLENLETLMSSAVSPLLRSIDDAISAIIVTMHNEDFGYSSTNYGNSQPQCSLYMRELQEFIGRVWRDYLAPFECSEFVYKLSTEVARTACCLFIEHASLVRPLVEGGKLRLAADFAQMELAVDPLCNRLDDLGEVYVWLRSLRPFLFQKPEEIVESMMKTKIHVPYSTIIQLIISQSPDELQSPHVTAGWSLTRYVEWLEDHPNELDRLQLLRGTLEAYARSVQAEGKTNYVSTYPLVLDLLKKGFDEAASVSK